MNTSSIEYKNIGASVRTPKVVTFISNKDRYWMHTVMMVIGWYSRMWGGGYNLIIPTDGKTIDDRFWKILERYNPDYLRSYYYAYGELASADKKRFEKDVEKFTAKLKRQNPDMTQDSIDDFISRELEMVPHHQFLISDDLQIELKQRLAPFFFQDHIVHGGVSWKKVVTFPFTQIEKIIQYTDVKHLFCIDLAKEYKNQALQLMVYSETGIAPYEYIHELKKQGVLVNDMPENYRLNNLLKDVVNGHVDLKSYKLERDLSETLKTRKPKEWIPDFDYLSQSPYSLSMLKLGKYHKRDEHRDWEEPVVLVVGDEVGDFNYYYSLSKAHGDFYWLPKSFIENFDKALSKKLKTNKRLTELESIPCTIMNQLFSKVGYGHDEKKILLTSLSLDKKELERLRKILVKACFSKDIEAVFEVADNQDFSACMLSAIEKDNYTNQQTHAFADGETVGRIETPKPINFSYIDPREHRWIAELTIDQYKLPRLHFLGHKTIPLSDAHDVRVSSDGISYLCPSLGYFGGEIDSILVKPKMRLVQPLAIFREFYQEAGYQKVTLSDKGQLSKRALEKFGSLDRIGYFLASEGNRKLIRKYLDGKPKYDRKTGEEIVHVNHRNYLNFQAIQVSLGDEKAAIQTIDELTTLDILHRGFIFHCEACLKSDWYSISDVKKSFICTRCSHEQKYEHIHWKSPNEPAWYYKLDEVIREGFIQNMDVPLMTLFQLKRKSKESFLFFYELGLWKDNVENGKPDIEIDINCIVDGKIVVGESKKDSITKSDIGKHGSFVKSLKKCPDRIVFSTLNESWSDEITQEIQKITNSEIILGKELVSTS